MIRKASSSPQPIKKVFSRLLNTQWLLVSIIIVLIIILASYFSGKNQLKSQQQSTLLLANSAGRYFENAVGVVRALAATSPSQTDLEIVQKSSSILDSLYVVKSDGKLFAIAPKNSQLKIGMDMSGHPNFQDGLITFILSKPFISPRTGKPTVYISFPITNGGGILIGEFNLKGLEENLSVMNLSQGVSFYITDATGVFLTHPNYELVNQQQNIGYLDSFHLDDEEIEDRVINDHGKLKFSVLSKIPQANWFAITETSILSVYGVIFYPAFFGLALIGLFYWLIVRQERELIINQVINPITELDRIAVEMSQGNFSENPNIACAQAYTEVVNLVSSFKYMQQAIQNHTEELRESEEKYRTVADFTYDWEAWRLPDGSFRYVSPSCERISGYTSEEFLEEPTLVITIVHPDDQKIVQDHYQEINQRSQIPTCHLDYRIITKNGRTRWISHWCSAVQNDKGEFLGRRESNRDITDRIEKEVELEKWGQIFENAEWGIAIGSADGKTVELFNPAYARMHGYEPSELKDLKIPDLFAPECRANIAKNIELTHQKGHHVWESRHIHKDGHTFPVEIDVTAVKDYKGNVKYRVVNVQDLSEKKRIESELRLSEMKFSTAFRTSPDSININRMADGLYIEINDGFTEMTGYTREDVAGKTSLEIDIWVNPEDRKRLVNGLKKDGIFNNLDAPFRCKDGRIINCLMSARVIEINGETCLLSITRDISDRILAETKLKESEEKFAKVFHEAPVWISIADFETGAYIDVNEEAIRATGFSRAEAIGHTAEGIGLFKKGDRQRILDELHKNGRVIDFEMTFTSKDGSQLFGLLNAEKIIVNGQECMLTIVNDITDRKKHEEQLQLLKYSIDKSFDCAYWMDMQGNFVYVNDAACRILGYSHEELMKLHVSAINPKVTPERWADVCHTLKKKKNITIESIHRRKDGTEFPVELSSGYFKFGDQEYINGFAKDITERKQTEEALLESIEYFKASFDNANIGACLVGLDGSFIKVNDEICRLTGYAREELEKIKFNDITHPEDREIGLKFIRQIIANEIKQSSFEKRYIHKSGKIVWVKISTSGVRNAQGETQYCVTYVQDITEEKNAEVIIKESEANLKNAQKYAHIGSWVWDIKTNQLDWSDEMFSIFGIEKESFTGDLQDVIAIAIHPEDREKLEASNKSVVELGKPIPLEYRIIRPDGSIRVVWAEAGELILDKDGAPSILKGTVQDITERKKAEVFSRNLITMNPVAIQVLDKDGFTLDVNPAFISLFGSVPPPDYSIFNDHQLMEQGIGAIFEQLRNGNVVQFPDVQFNPHDSLPEMPDVPNWVRTLGFPIGNKGEKPDRFVLMQENITERTRLEVGLKKSEEKNRLLISQMHQGLAVHEIILDDNGIPVDYRFLDVNKSFESLTGLKAENIIGKTVLEVLPETEKSWIEKYGRVAMTGEPIEFEDFHAELGKYYGVVAYSPQPKQFAVIVTDITTRKAAEKQLNEQLDELKRWYEVTLNRESRILELKHEVNELLSEEQKPIRYPSAEEDNSK